MQVGLWEKAGVVSRVPRQNVHLELQGPTLIGLCATIALQFDCLYRHIWGCCWYGWPDMRSNNSWQALYQRHPICSRACYWFSEPCVKINDSTVCRMGLGPCAVHVLCSPVVGTGSGGHVWHAAVARTRTQTGKLQSAPIHVKSVLFYCLSLGHNCSECTLVFYLDTVSFDASDIFTELQWRISAHLPFYM